MAKSAIRRHHAQRLQDKWNHILSHQFPDLKGECITFGRIYSKDPLDCGNPKCGLCSHAKNYDTSRTSLRKEERSAMNDYFTGA